MSRFIALGAISTVLSACLKPPSQMQVATETAAASTTTTSTMTDPTGDTTSSPPTGTSTGMSSSTSVVTDSSSGSSTGSPAYCGDGMQDEGEDCDTAMNVLPKEAKPGDCTKECKIAGCGNGALEGSEECDDSNTEGSDKCTTQCTLTKCGDGITQSTNGAEMMEECDDGNKSDNDSCPTTCQKAKCGDGFVLGGPAEECDDGNLVDDDDCNNMCIAAPRYIFVSSSTSNGNLGGIEAANKKCKTLADASMLESVKNKQWRAWLSDASSSPADAVGIMDFKGWYHSPKGTQIAHGASALRAGSLLVPVNIDEQGNPQTSYVWTGTREDGTMAMDLHCSAWATSDKLFSGLLGNSVKSDGTWTEEKVQGVSIDSPCHLGMNRIYCVQVPSP